MQCKQCGKPVPAGADCPHCQTNGTTGPAGQTVTDAKSNKTNIWLIIGIVALALIVSACCLISIGAALVIPALSLARHDARKTTDSNNLKQIGIALHGKADCRTGRFILASRNSRLAEPNSIAGRSFQGPNATGKQLEKNVTAAIYRLISSGAILPKTLICPNVDQLKACADIPGAKDFASPDQFGYSFINMYGNAYGQWRAVASTTTVIAGNRNNGGPNGSGQADTNSADWDGRGQHALFADGHVEWSTNTNMAFSGDDIYGTGDPSTYNANDVCNTTKNGKPGEADLTNDCVLISIQDLTP